MKKKMNKALLLGVLTLFALSSFGQETLSKERALTLTLKNNFDIILAQNAEAIAANNASILNSGYLPTVSATGSGDYSVRDTKVGLNNGETVALENTNSVNYNAAATISYTIFDGLGRKYNYQKLKETHQLTELQTKALIEATVNQLMTNYYNLVSLQLQKDLLQQTLSISKERLLRAETNFDYGQGSKIDILNAEVDFNTDSINYLNANLQWQNAQRDLNFIMGVPIENKYTLESDVTFNQDLNLGELMSSAKNQNITVQTNNLNAAIAQLDAKIAKAGWLPTITASGSYTFSNNNNDSNSGFNSPLAVNYANNYGPAASLNLNWNLFDGGRTKVQNQNAQILIQNQQVSIDQTLLSIERDVANAWQRYENALVILNTQSTNVSTNEQNFERSEDLFKLGQINSLTFRQAQINLLNAQTSYNQAIYDAKLAEIRLLQLSGSILDETL